MDLKGHHRQIKARYQFTFEFGGMFQRLLTKGFEERKVSCQQ